MKFSIETKGHYDFLDITDHVAKAVSESKIKDGVAHVFVKGSTAAITAMEYEEGIMKDLINVFEAMAPEDADYEHHKRWGDHNGAAHIKSAIVGPSFSAPVQNGELLIGTWQQIVLIDFDEKPRTRDIIITLTQSK